MTGKEFSWFTGISYRDVFDHAHHYKLLEVHAQHQEQDRCRIWFSISKKPNKSITQFAQHCHPRHL